MAVTSIPVSTASSFSRGSWRDLDWVLLVLVLVSLLLELSYDFLGLATPEGAFDARPAVPTTTASGAASGHAVTSASNVKTTRSSDVMKQLMWIAVGLSAMALLTVVDYQLLMHLQFWIYSLSLGMLAAVLVIGREINGAKSWIPIGPFMLQPSEFTKVAVMIALAAFLCRRQEKIGEVSTLLWSLLYMAPPLLLILKQPDFGTMLSVLAIWFGMLFFGGARLWHLTVVMIVGLTLFGAAWRFNAQTASKARLAVFLDTHQTTRESQRTGYHITQSQIAIGGGEITGQGWGRGMQNRAGYVPEKTTDFIFAVVAEELGFVGASALLLMYLLLLSRAALLANATDNYFGVLIAGGFTALIAFHTIVNLGMTMRVMPITGVPLPFFSYGGSSYVSFASCAGILQSISLRRRRLVSY